MEFKEIAEYVYVQTIEENNYNKETMKSISFGLIQIK